MYASLIGILTITISTVAVLCVGMDTAKLPHPIIFVMNGGTSIIYLIGIAALLRSRLGSR